MTFAALCVHTGAMTDPPGTDNTQPQPADPGNSQQADSEPDLVDLYDDELLATEEDLL